MKAHKAPYLIKSIAEEHHFWSLPKPRHPLVSVYRFEDTVIKESLPELFMFDFYCISIKKNFKGKCVYGQHYYDFGSGVMTFLSPKQIMSHPRGDDAAKEGICLVFHAGYLLGYPLAKTIGNYGFFSYELSEALHLSEQEEATIEGIMDKIALEYQSNIDHYSQDVIVAQIELLLQYCNRFYNRQFITRKPQNSEILTRLEKLLNNYFNDPERLSSGLPTVQYIADELHLSPNYLSDMLRSFTGQTTQQHIHAKLIDKAKELLSTTSLSVSEVAFHLGFDYPQSFNKLFKNKTNYSPTEFRQSFN
ncbi:helix-turn-helix domain-containing protein [Mucilaginibacter jinjuensis]|uniref:Helix-turn-helix transcriptional regulator n=1 Tax=Mucilaginibacter jinjuensis TaxID=1176721 RepID=A0ABY7TDL3_9SPHI|nr:response regulator transcription factor [Mucilaginibacter jinjuensis]WCT14329.1 helix-turn-helix transcriptional regulator [Mucilaginibacter jinjuensis]